MLIIIYLKKRIDMISIPGEGSCSEGLDTDGESWVRDNLNFFFYFRSSRTRA